MSANEETVPNPPMSGMREMLREKLREICRTLNIDANTEQSSWEAIETTLEQFDLTGNIKHWICCALYGECLKELPAVGHPGHFVQGNGVNITKLLTQCNISIQDFFTAMKNWAEIRSLPGHLQKTLDNLLHGFSVSITAYTVFCVMFPRIFNEANIVPDEPKRSKKSKPNPCSYNKLREFCWVLFLNVKEEHSEQRNDLATAKDLCVCVFDLIYINLVAEGRMDLINPKVLSEGGSSSVDGTTAAAEAAMRVNLREQLCKEYATSNESVDGTNLNIFLPSLAGMLEANELKGTSVTALYGVKLASETYTGLVSVANFEENNKSLNRRYESAILKCGMLDERIVLSSRTSPTSQRNRWSDSIAGHPRTPLSIKSGRAGAPTGNRIGIATGGGGSDLSTNSPFLVRGTLTQLMKKIQGHHRGQPRGNFLVLMKNCTPSPLDTVLEHVAQMRNRFVEKLIEGERWHARTAEIRFDAIEGLYYQLLENIIPWELKKRPTMTVPKVIFDLSTNNMFNETLIVCAAEIIFFLRQEQHNFPWILDVFGMEPFQFFSIIEVTVSANSDIFTSDIVNHLRRIEEQIVDSISWKSSSILWDCMEKENYKIPSNKDVELRAEIAGVTPLKSDSIPNTPNGARGGGSSGIAGSIAAGPSSSMVTSATGRPTPHPDSAKKKLFVDPAATPTKISPATASTTSNTGTAVTGGTGAGTGPSAASSELANVPGYVINGSNDSKSISSLSSPQRGINDNNPPSIETRRLNFFFRKMYQVAYYRLCNLCQNLGIDSEATQKLIWTIFEYTITKSSKDLPRDRHLDQLLMCAIFVTVRLKKLPNTFKQIMHCYLSQPQANSSIYRSVFIRYENTAPGEGGNKGDDTNGRNDEPTGENKRLPVTEMGGTSVQYGREVYGDIIKFYNDIYVLKVYEFAMQYINTDVSQESLFLSPTPKSQTRNIQKSPRQISSGINLFVSTTNKICSLQDSPNVRELTFSSSPGQSPTIHDRKIPALARDKSGDTVVRKGAESSAFESTVPPKMRRLDKIHQDRQHQDHESSEIE
ncbi:retinoblastoma family protein-like isoform X1 [Anopheles moucheti]|uniref:retinoblastoma family protein-like isoform X1 n=1 Tax=Anopheles moucheti TaxID=186751 RepID=UPI0022F142B6|nr:retinoblastoma family protein-like isoform X1 [Anopheles moucheti]